MNHPREVTTASEAHRDVAGYRLTADLACKPFECEEGPGPKCKTCRPDSKRTDELCWQAEEHANG